MPQSAEDPAREDELRWRLQEAIKALQSARAECDRLFAVSSELNTPDGAFAAQKAARIQRAALQRLRTTLKDFEVFTARSQGRS